MEINLSGKLALITGASRGIGFEIAEVLTKAGARIVALDIDPELKKLKEKLPQVEIVFADLRDWTATKAALEPWKNKIDLLVNNAGVIVCQPLEEITEESVDFQYSINVKAVINVTQSLIEGMKARGSGAIVNISSVAGKVGLQDHIVYGGTKAAIDLTTKIMALELCPYGIRVNSVNPTVTWTALAQQAWGEPQRKSKMLSKIPLGHFVEPTDVANLVTYLLSDKASMITGTNFPIDGGVGNTSL